MSNVHNQNRKSTYKHNHETTTTTTTTTKTKTIHISSVYCDQNQVGISEESADYRILHPPIFVQVLYETV